MWTHINNSLKQRAPSLHSLLKRRVTRWRLAPDPALPCLKRIRGELFLAHPRLLTADTRDAEPHIWEWIRAHLPRGGVFLDVGAHYGWLSMKACRVVAPSGRVFAFEPSPALVEMLRYHQRRNRLRQLAIIGSAVSDTTGAQMLWLLNDGLSSRNSLTIGAPGLPFLESVRKTTVEVPTVTLDGFCGAQALTPDVIKIDVEGAEAMVLRGAVGVLTRSRPVLVLSTHPYWMPPSDSVAAMFALLRHCGYTVKESRVTRFAGFEPGDYLCYRDQLISSVKSETCHSAG